MYILHNQLKLTPEHYKDNILDQEIILLSDNSAYTLNQIKEQITKDNSYSSLEQLVADYICGYIFFNIDENKKIDSIYIDEMVQCRQFPEYYEIEAYYKVDYVK